MSTSVQASSTEVEELLKSITREIIQRPGLRKLAFSLLEGSIDRWSGKSRIKKALSRPVKRLFSGLARPGITRQDHDHLPAHLGRLITALARDLNEGRKKDREKHEIKREQAISDFIVNTDLGEIREMVQASEETVLRTLDMTNITLFRYPAKIASILAILVDIMNITLKSIVHLIKPLMDNLGPDLTADIMLTSFRNIQGKEVGKIIGNITEMLRRLHAGSLLLGKGGTPLFKVYLSDFLNDLISGIDPEILQKARIALSEDRRSLQEALVENLQDNHDLLKSFITSYSDVKNPSIQASSIKVRMFEDLAPKELADAMQEGLSGLDVQEAAEIVNSVTRIANSIHEENPDLFYNLFKSFSDAIDPEELKFAMEWMVPELTESIRPLAYAFMPQLVNAFCELITPLEGDETPEHIEAMQRLRKILAESKGDKDDQ